MSGYGKVVIKSNSKFLKIEAGQPQDVRILDDAPTEVFKHQVKTGSPLDCVGASSCFRCMEGDQPMQKFITNVYSHSLGKVLLWEYSGGVAKSLKAIATTLEEEGKNILDVDLKVDAQGSGKDKRYSVTPRMTSKQVPPGARPYKIGISDIPF